MPGPNILVQRAFVAGRAYELRGSSIAEQIGGNLPLHFGPLDGSGGNKFLRNTLARIGGELHSWLRIGNGNTHWYVYDEDTDTWVLRFNSARDGGAIDDHAYRALGFASVTGTDGAPYLVCAFHDAGGILTWVRVDQNGTYTEFTPYATFTSLGQSPNAPFVWKNQVWCVFNRSTSSDIDKLQSFDPATGVATQYAWPATSGGTGFQCVLFSLDDRLFLSWCINTNVSNEIFEFKFGGWVPAKALGSGFFWSRRGAGSSRPATAFYHNDAAYVVFCGQTGDPSVNTTQSGIWVYKVTVPTPGDPLTLNYLGDPVVPPSLRPGTNTVLNSQYYGLWSFVDDQTDPANPQPYIIFCPDTRSSTFATLFRYVNDGTELEVAANMPVTSEYAFPDTYWGSGAFLNGRETASAKLVTAHISASAKGAQGVLLNFRVFGDPLVVPHGAVTSGPFEVGETITSSSGGSATILQSKPTVGEVRVFGVTGTFLNGDTLTQTTGLNAGANATQGADSSGGLADKTVRFRYYLNGTRTLGVPSTGVCSLIAGTNTAGNIVGGNEIQNLRAEHFRSTNSVDYGVEWNFITDGVPETSTVTIKAEVVRP